MLFDSLKLRLALHIIWILLTIDWIHEIDPKCAKCCTRVAGNVGRENTQWEFRHQSYFWDHEIPEDIWYDMETRRSALKVDKI